MAGLIQTNMTGVNKKNNLLVNNTAKTNTYQYDPSKSGPENEALSRQAAYAAKPVVTAPKTTPAVTNPVTAPAAGAKRTISPVKTASFTPAVQPSTTPTALPLNVSVPNRPTIGSISVPGRPSVGSVAVPGRQTAGSVTVPGRAATPRDIAVGDLSGRVSGYDPERRTVDPRTETVEGRIEGIVAKDSPLMQQAETRAKQKMSGRGLLNSSMAIGAGQSALYDTALPIASQDASTYSQTASENQRYGNEALQFGAGAKNRAAEAEFGAGQEAEKARFGAEQETGMADFNARREAGLAEFGADQEYGMADFNARREAGLTEFGAGQEAEMAKFGADREAGLARFGAEQEAEMARYGLEGEAGMAEFKAQQDRQILDRQAEIETQLQGIRGDQAMDLATLEQEYGMLARTSEDAANALATTNTAISAILSNPDIKAEQKDALVSRQVELLRNNLAVIGSIGNVDLEGLLDYGGEGGFVSGTGAGGGDLTSDKKRSSTTDLLKLGLRPDKLKSALKKLF